MIRLLIVVVVLGVGGYIGYHWWHSRTSGNGGYHGVAARRYRTAYRLCKHTVGGKLSLSGAGARLMSRAIRGRYHDAVVAGCAAGAQSGGLSGVLNQLEHSTGSAGPV
jgi:hypothetical protein